MEEKEPESQSAEAELANFLQQHRMTYSPPPQIAEEPPAMAQPIQASLKDRLKKLLSRNP